MDNITTPYLIQRMKFKKNPAKNCSFGGLLQMDYMGSAEFEFGALPKSLRVIRDNIGRYEIIVVEDVANKNSENLCFISPENIIDQYRPHIISMVEGKWRGKECLKLRPHITGKSDLFSDKPASQYDLESEAWWDIENNVIFTFGIENAGNIMSAIKNTVFSSEKK